MGSGKGTAVANLLRDIMSPYQMSDKRPRQELPRAVLTNNFVRVQNAAVPGQAERGVGRGATKQ